MSDAADAIRNLLHRYAECVDAADFAGVGALFADGAIRAPGLPEPVRGAAAVQRLYEASNRVHPDGTLRTLHLVANPIVELDAGGAAASCRSRYVVLQATPSLPLQPIIAGRYFDRFACAAGVWRFAERGIAIDLVGDLSHHLLFDLRRSV
ncbi:MAG: nuclear transport factor 2 family protein [Proteobacteria bacterium]|nr:MAG: nuclear transport factor 2 family protein [Pseudomonadota bacterium]